MTSIRVLVNHPWQHFLPYFLAATILGGPNALAAQQDFSNVQIETVPVADGVYMLVGQGGNIGVSIGDDGVFLIDDQYAPLTEKIKAAVTRLSDRDVQFVVNTHWHFDHTGGNEQWGEAGSIIVAHENVRERMSVEQFMEAFDRRVPPSPAAALPVITFTDAVTFHWNGDDIHVFHVETAHTDGDGVVHFANANAVHMGDTFFNGMYPFIDVSSGGSIDGMIGAANRVLRMANSETKIIPGHGPLSGIEELRAYRDMLTTVRDHIRAMLNDGMTKDQIIAAKPTADLDAVWGGGFMQPDIWVGLVVDGMTN